jgi:hypothetical protein
MRTLGLIRRATPSPPHDLWPRLRARLADDERIALRLPALGWREAAAVAVALGILVVVPDPLRFLAASGMF